VTSAGVGVGVGVGGGLGLAVGRSLAPSLSRSLALSSSVGSFTSDQSSVFGTDSLGRTAVASVCCKQDEEEAVTHTGRERERE
jgi:hypothetical protein